MPFCQAFTLRLVNTSVLKVNRPWKIHNFQMIKKPILKSIAKLCGKISSAGGWRHSGGFHGLDNFDFGLIGTSFRILSAPSYVRAKTGKYDCHDGVVDDTACETRRLAATLWNRLSPAGCALRWQVIMILLVWNTIWVILMSWYGIWYGSQLRILNTFDIEPQKLEIGARCYSPRVSY